MTPRNAYLIQIIEQIGTPLLSSVLARNETTGSAKSEAQSLAELLSRSVMLSIELGKLIEIEKTSPEQSDSLRVAMAALASQMVANQYAQLGKVPADGDIQKITGALQAVMTFSDNFAPSAENAARLERLRADGLPADAHQINIQYLQAFTPVADVIASFPFGQSERKMVQDAADRITARAKTIRSTVFGENLDEHDRKLTELALVKALADVYTQSHRAEMNKLMTLQDPQPDSQQKALQALWDNFDIRAGILEALTAHIMPASGARAPAPVAAAPPPPAPPPVQQYQQPAEAPPPAQQYQQPVEQPPMQPPPPVTQQPPAAPPQAAAPSGNPMSMFAKPKPAGEQEIQAAPPPPPPVQQYQQPVEAVPPVQQYQQPAEQSPYQIPAEEPPPAAQQPPAAPPAAQQPPAAPPAAGGSPMSFFKSPPKEEGEE